MATESDEHAAKIYDDFRGLSTEQDLKLDASPLFEKRRVYDLMRLRNLAPERFVRLMEEWKAEGVKRLPDLRKAIERMTRAYAKRDRSMFREADKDGLIRNSEGQILPSPENIETAIKQLGVRLRFDSFSGCPTIDGLPGFGPALEDAALNRLYLAIGEEFGFLPPDQLFQKVASDVAMRNRFHPVRDHLDDLVTYGVWDRTPRLDTWLIDYADAKDTPYVRAVGALVLVAAVRRVRQPGCKFDEMLVLESAEQGYGKSSLVAALAVKDSWFTDSVPLAADDKVVIERTSGKWILEIGELQGMRKGEIERVRAQLSRTHDRARLAYARLSSEVPRQSISIGTTNGSEDAPYLADIAGNRRFWPVTVGRCDVAGLAHDIDQLWAEAALREAEGVSIRLPEELWAEAGREQQARAVGNPFTDVLAPILGNREGILLSDDAWRIVRIPPERRGASAGNFGRAMKELGWDRKQRRIGGARTWVYSKGGAAHQLRVEEDTLGRGGFMVFRSDELEGSTEG